MPRKNTDQRKTSASFRQRLIERTDTPPGLFSRESSVFVTGKRSAEISGCISVLEYEEERIVLWVKGGFLIIQGEGMELQLFQKDQLTVIGSIQNIAWKNEKGELQ
jgi:sporulation protein YqfC